MNCDIAIIGMACRFPGAKTIEEFWENLKSGKDTIHTFPDKELEQAGIDEQLISSSSYVKRRGIIDGIEYFDSGFFGVSPYEASITDPQQKVFLEICWEALERSGYSENKEEVIVGIFAGAGDNTYFDSFLEKNNEFLKSHHPYQAGLLNSSHFLTTRVSYLLNLKGPSISVGTGCSTSLVAIIQACQSLALNDCDIALAGGVTIRVPQVCGYVYQEGSIYSPDGKCRAFDEKASGTVPSNGAGVVVLKRLTDAIRDGDNIEAVIKSYAINNDGNAKAGYTAPSVLEQTRCIATAMADIDNVENIAHVEAHGTGTILGDPIEITALSKAFEFYTQKRNFCAVGSVKTNIGHTDTAAGIAGFIKSVLILKNKAVPASLNFNNANPHISFENSPFYVCKQYKSVGQSTSPLCASVSSFGIGGTNTHIILEEAPKQQIASVTKPSHLILLSAKTPSALVQQQNNLLNYLNEQEVNNEDLANIAYTLQVGKNKFNSRGALICSDIEHLKHLLQVQNDQDRLTNKDSLPKTPKVVFLFQGQGTLYKGCIRDIYFNLPTFRIYLDKYCNYLKSEVRRMILDYILHASDASSEDYKDPLLQQLATFIVEYSLAKTYIKYGVKPDVLVGHSLGEYTAACIAGITSLEDTINLISLRAELTGKLPPGLMLSVPIAIDKISKYIKDSNVSIAAINSPNSCVISGTVVEIGKLQAVFDNEVIESGQKCTVLKMPYAFHSQDVERIVEEYSQVLNALVFHQPSIPIITTVTGDLLDYEQIRSKNHFKEHFRKTVLFSKCIERLIKDNFNVFLEIGVGQTLSSLVKQHQDNLITISSLPREKDFIKNQVNQFTYFNRALGLCWTNFINIDWAAYYDNEKKQHISLPTYPFERNHCWIDPSSDVTDKVNKGPFIYEPYWELTSLADLKTFDKKEIWLIFADTFGIADQLIAKLATHEQIVVCVKAGDCFKQINANCYQINPEKKSDYEQLIELLISQKQWPNQVMHLWSFSENSNKDPDERLQQTLEYGFFSLVNFFQVLAKYNRPPLCLTVVTNHLKAICSTDYIVPEKSTMLGFCLVLPQETSTLARIIDADALSLSANQQNNLIDAILNETAIQPTNSIVVYRNDLRFVNGFKQHEKTPLENNPHCLRQQGVYVIVGGLGKIGLALAEFLANSYKAHLILIARNILPAERDIENRIFKLKKTASSLRILKADISDYSQTQNAFAIIKTEFPKVDGIFHLAATLNSSARTLIKDLQIEPAYEQFKPKIEGTKILAKLIHEISPRFCAFFSSLSAIIGGSELCGYAASNCGLDSLIEYYQSNKQTRWIGINWDAWAYEHKDNTTRSALSFAQGFRLLQVCLRAPRNARFVVTSNDLNLLTKEWVNYKDVKIIALPSVKKPAKPLHIDSTVDMSIELVLKQLVKDCLGTKHVEIKDDFYALGGDSLSLLRLYEMINQAFPGALKLVDLIRNRSVCALCEFLKNKSIVDYSSCLVKIRDTGKKQPLFLIHPVGGTVFCYIELAKYLSIDHPLITIQDPLLESDQIPFATLEDMARYYIQAIKSVQSDGPYLIGGYSFGANVAFEIASQLEQQGENLTLFIIDGWARYSEQLRDRTKNFNIMMKIVEETTARIPDFVYNKDKFLNLLWKRMELLFQYQPKKIISEIILFKARIILPEYEEVDEATNHWQNYSEKPINSRIVGGDHLSILNDDNAKQIAEVLNQFLSTSEI